MLVDTAPPSDAKPRRRPHRPSVGAIVFAVLATPPFFFYFNVASSLTFGATVLAAGLLIALEQERRAYSSAAWVAPVVLAIVAHLAMAASLNRVDLPRALGSLVPLTLLLLAAGRLAGTLASVPGRRVHRALHRCFFAFCAIAIAGVLDLAPPTTGEWHKPIFPFTEPSMFALAFVPVLLYTVVTSTGWTRLAYFCFALLCTGLIQNLTLVAGCALALLASYRLSALVIIGAAITLTASTMDLTYYTSRLDFSGEVSNLSNLVWVQGWQFIDESFERSRGLGLGFQQLGINGTDVPAAQLLRALRQGEDLNLLDGGFLFSKLSSEFGLLGVVLAAVFVFVWIRSLLSLRRIAVRPAQSSPITTLAHCCVVGFFVEFLVRGSGYFTAGGLLLVTSMLVLRAQRRRAAVATRPLLSTRQKAA